MKIIKNGLLILAALFFVLLGAAMPYLASRMQDAQLSGFQKNSELNRVNLTLQQGEEELSPASENFVSTLEILSRNYAETTWMGKTALSREDASQLALSALGTMENSGLTLGMAISSFAENGAKLNPVLLASDDGSSALVWEWSYWRTGYSMVHITLDDATGKLVRMIETIEQPYDDMPLEDLYVRMSNWLGFIQEYYDCFIESTEESNAAERVFDDGHIQRSVEFSIGLTPMDGSEPLTFSLDIGSDYTFFNY